MEPREIESAVKFLIPIAFRYGSIVAQFALISLVARALSNDDVGTYFFLSGLVLSGYFLAGFGIPDGLVTESVAIKNDVLSPSGSTTFHTATTYALLLSVAPASLASVAIYYYEDSLQIGIYTGLWLMGYALVFIAAQLLITMGRANSGSFIFYSAVSSTTCIITLPYLLLSESATLERTLQLNATSSMLAGLVALAIPLKHARFKPGLRYSAALSHLWRTGAYIAIGRILQAGIIWMPVWITAATVGKSEAGVVGLACRLLSIVGAVLAAVRFSIRPQITQLAASGDWCRIETLGRSIGFWATLLALSAAVAVATIGETIITALFGEPYSAAATLLLILLGASISESLGGPVDEILKMTGRSNTVLLYQIISAVFMLLLGTALSSTYGAAGICFAFAASFALLYGLQIHNLYAMRGILALPSLPRRIEQ